MNRQKYLSDSRYAKVLEQMDLLNIMDVSTTTQDKNGTIVWRLPMKGRGNTNIEYGSFSTGYVRNQGNQCHSNWQINTRVDSEPQYFELPNGDYRKYVGKVCKMIPNEIDRLEYMMKYVIKNEFIKRASYDSIPRLEHINTLQASEGYYKDKLKVYKENAEFNQKLYNKYKDKFETAKKDLEFHEARSYEYGNNIENVTVTIDGHKYKLI